MDIGMLWFDNRPGRTLEEKVKDAAAYYQKKYGAMPNKVLVNQKEAPQGSVEGFTVQGSAQVLPNHLWIGVEHESQAA